ncbi:MAG: deoxyribose-phosphate aldolase [Phycisphaeraceae bacterium]|nr:deoxyribose-phosphate aldolase [Phycisphaeraceae bacterium]
MAPTVDRVMAEARAASFRTRSIKKDSKVAALKLALAMCDLTTLEGKDSPEKIRALCAKAIRPMPDDEAVFGERLPSVAAVCVYPSLVGLAREYLDGSGVKVASVATGFPSGQYPLAVRLRDCQRAIRDGADEIDMVINRGAFLAGRFDEVAKEIREVVAVCDGADGDVHLKVILETGELETYDNVRRASDLAISCIRSGDFIKTSTGKISPAATMPVTLVMLEAIRDEFLRSMATTGKKSQPRLIGMKPAGGIRDAKTAVHYVVMVSETMGELRPPRSAARRGSTGAPATGSKNGRALAVCPWLTPAFFRFGASSLVNDVLRQLVRQKTGRYAAWHDFTES